MPYKNPERKRQWEREHREKRDPMRRMQRLNARSGHPSIPKSVPDPVLGEKPQGTWKTFLRLVVEIGAVLLAAFGAANVGSYGDPG